MNRRTALKTLALASAASALPGALNAQTSSTAAAPAPVVGPFSLPPLPYAPAALEPHIDTQTMGIHHDKHHGAYVNNLNKLVKEQPNALPTTNPVDLIQKLDQVPEAFRTLVRNNAGGHVNHTLFWTSLSAKPASPSPALVKAIDRDLGGMDGLKKSLTETALKVFGSGWAWLSLSKEGKLVIEPTPNQDNPLMHGNQPLLGLDVWEHAYYLRYQNRRADYLSALFNIIAWDAVSERFTRKI
ncbi:MAG: superoxide dismutase [Candidatus Methylacidiphilales bacterium]|nr:superoxide dismutase [Candidatus Methylacidiphilales bacterium]